MSIPYFVSSAAFLWSICFEDKLLEQNLWLFALLRCWPHTIFRKLGFCAVPGKSSPVTGNQMEEEGEKVRGIHKALPKVR